MSRSNERREGEEEMEKKNLKDEGSGGGADGRRAGRALERGAPASAAEWGPSVWEMGKETGFSKGSGGNVAGGARVSRVVLGSGHRPASSAPIPVALARPESRERAHPEGGAPLPLPPRPFPPQKAWTGSQGGAVLTPFTLGVHGSRAGRAKRHEDWAPGAGQEEERRFRWLLS